MRQRLYLPLALVLGVLLSPGAFATSEVHNPLARLCQEALLWAKTGAPKSPPLPTRSQRTWDEVLYPTSEAAMNDSAQWHRLNRLLRRRGIQVKTQRNPLSLASSYGEYSSLVSPLPASPCILNRLAAWLQLGLDCSVRFVAAWNEFEEPLPKEVLQAMEGEFWSDSVNKSTLLWAGAFENLELVTFHEAVHAYLVAQEEKVGESLLSGSWVSDHTLSAYDSLNSNIIDFSEVAAWSADIYLQALAYSFAQDDGTRLRMKDETLASASVFLVEILGPLVAQSSLALEFLESKKYRATAEALRVEASSRKLIENDDSTATRSPFVFLRSRIRYRDTESMGISVSFPRRFFPELREETFYDFKGNAVLYSRGLVIADTKRKKQLVNQIASHRIHRLQALHRLAGALVNAVKHLYIALSEIAGPGTIEDQTTMRKRVKAMHFLVTKAMQEKAPFWEQLKDSKGP
jgi:hypothetical protein